MNRIKEGLALDQTRLNNKVEARKIVTDEQDRQMRIKEFNASQEERAANRKIREDAAKDKQDIANSRLNELKFVNAGAKLLGKREFQSIQDLELYAKSTEGKLQFQKLYDVGYQAANSAAGSGKDVVISPDPADSGSFLVDIRGRLAPTMKKTQDLITKTVIGVRQQADGYKQEIDLKNPEAVKGAINKRITREVEDMARDTTKNSDTNIYSPPTWQSMAVSMPIAVTKNKLFDKLFKQEVAATESRDFDPQYVIQRTVDAIQKKEVTYAEAFYGLRSLMTAAVETNNIHNGYSRVGLPEQKTFNATLKTDPNAIYFDNPKSVDLTDYVQLSTVLNKMLVNKVLTERGNISRYNTAQQEVNTMAGGIR
jgi:hypothetical protein